MPTQNRMSVGAVVVAGGRSSRLQRSSAGASTNKVLLSNGNGTLLGSVLADLLSRANVGPRSCVVVGPTDLPVPSGIRVVREDPPFAGPAAAIRAGLLALSGDDAPLWFFLVAADMPCPGPGFEALLHSAHRDQDGSRAFVGSEAGRRQPLMSLVRFDAAVEAFRDAPAGSSVMSGMKRLDPTDVDLPAGASADIDTWEDAVALGFDVTAERHKP